MHAGIIAEFFTTMNHLQMVANLYLRDGYTKLDHTHASTHTNTLTVHVQLVLFEGEISQILRINCHL